LGGLELVRLDDPFKMNDSDIWHVPGLVKWNMGMKDGDVLRVRYDESLGRYIVCGGP